MELETGKILRWKQDPRVFVREVLGVTPDPWQDDVLEAFPTSPRMAMVACKGPGKSQPLQTLIETPDGQRRFGDLVVGDLVFGADGSPVTVTGIFEQGVLPVYRVSFDDGSSTLASGDHLWRVRGRTERRHDSWAVLTTEEIVSRGVRERNGRWQGRHFEIPRQGAVAFPAADLPLDSYVLGVWLGDGVRCCGRYATKPTDEIEAEIQRRGYRTSGVKGGVVTVYGMAVILASLGIGAFYSHERYVPEQFKRGSAQQRRDLICGLMDTDGEIGADGHMAFASTSERLITDLQWLVRSVGGIAYQAKSKQPFYYNADREKIPGRTCYRLTINLPFNPFRVPHRQVRWRDPSRNPSSLRYLTRKIDSIERAGEAECRCISVSAPDGLYLTNDFIVTHNTAVMSWLCWNFLLTRPNPNIAAVSITGENLSDNLWKEMAVWQAKSALLKRLFEWKKTRIESRESPQTWWMSARMWPRGGSAQDQANTLAGLHADYVMFILDESGAMPEAVMASAEAALSSCTEGHIVQAGNPTQTEGPLWRAATASRRLWRVFNITGDPDDPKRAPRVSIEWAREQIEQYGRDNPFVLVNVFGQFPPSSLTALVGPDDIQAASRRSYRESDIARSARVLGVDVALFGDDASVMWPRQGLVAYAPSTWRGLDGPSGAARVAIKWREWEADAAMVDGTGGFGAAWIDALRLLGLSPISVGFATAAASGRYFNKRAEMYFEAAEWIKRGGQLPPMGTPGMPEFTAAMTRTSYTARGDRLLIEPKGMVKSRIGFSPDHADAFALTFAAPVARSGVSDGPSWEPARHIREYDPFSDNRVRGGGF